MKKICILVAAVIFVILSSADVKAQENINEPYNDSVISELQESLNLDEMYDKLPDEAKKSLENMGITSVDSRSLSNVTLEAVINSIVTTAGKQGRDVFIHIPILVSVLMIYSVVDNLKNSMTGTGMSEVLSVVTALCIACALVIPVTKVIEDANNTVYAASQFMLAYIPVMVAVLISVGRTLSGAGYYSLMIGAAQAISQLSTKFITPMLNVFLGISITSCAYSEINLQSVVSMLSKSIKWLLSFSFTVFSALLTFKTLISTSLDSVSTRAVRYTMSSFIPVVGAALSEAYKTIQGSVNVLKNGIGIFVIFAVAAVFMPIIIKLMLWIFSVGVVKTISQVMGLNTPYGMLNAVSTVLSVLFAVVICIMALFIISTALIITAGGYGG